MSKDAYLEEDKTSSFFAQADFLSYKSLRIKMCQKMETMHQNKIVFFFYRFMLKNLIFAQFIFFCAVK